MRAKPSKKCENLFLYPGEGCKLCHVDVLTLSILAPISKLFFYFYFFALAHCWCVFVVNARWKMEQSFCSCCCCLQIKNRSDLYPVPL